MRGFEERAAAKMSNKGYLTPSSDYVLQVYWYYTDQGYRIYLRNKMIDKLLIDGVNFVTMNSLKPISLVSILIG